MKWIRFATAVAVVMVSVLAAYVSYRHIYQIARKNGEDDYSAWTVPLTVDGLIFSASMVILRAGRIGTRAPTIAWCALALGVASTGFANAAHGRPYGTIGVLVSAWPAVSLLASFEMLMRLFRQPRVQPPKACTAQDEPGTGARPAAAVPAAQPRHSVQARVANTGAARPAQAQRAQQARPVQVQSGQAAQIADAAQRAQDRHALGTRLYHESVQAGTPLSQTDLARALGMTNRKLAARIIGEYTPERRQA